MLTFSDKGQKVIQIHNISMKLIEKSNVVLDDITNVDFQKEVSCRVTNSVLKYLESHGYVADSILEGLSFSREFLTNPFNWVPYETRELLCRRATELTKDPAFMYRVGLETPKLKPLGGIESMIKLLIGPKTAYRSISKYSSLFDKVFKFDISLEDNDHATITMSMNSDYPASKDSCYYAQGILAAIPTLWGLPPAEVREKKCMCQADIGSAKNDVRYEAKSCEFEVYWQNIQSSPHRLLENLLFNGFRKTTDVKELERNFRLLDQKNAELVARNKQLAQVREIALGVDRVKTLDEALGSVVEQARGIEGILFVLVQRLDTTREFVITPYYSRIRGQFKYMVDGINALGFDIEKELGKNPTSNKFRLPISKLKIAQNILKEPKVMDFTNLRELLDGVWPHFLCDSMQRIMGVKRLVLVPLIVDGEYWGSILYFLTNEVPLDILEMIGVHCSTAIKNISNVEVMSRQNRKLLALNSIADITSRSLDMQRLLTDSVKEFVSIFNANASAIYLWDETSKALKLAAQYGMPEKTLKSHNTCPADSQIGKFFLSQEELLVGDLVGYASEFPNHLASEANIPPLKFASSILRKGSSRYGLVTVVRVGSSQFSDEEKTVLLSITKQIAVAAENYDLHADVLKRMTEAESARIKLESSESKFYKAFHSSPEIIFITSSNGKYLEVNESYTRFSGYTREEVLGRKTTEIDTWVNPSNRDRILAKIAEQGHIYNEETQFRVKSGDIHTLIFSNEVINIDNEPCLIFVGTDISERKKMEERLANEAIRRRILIEQSRDGIVILDHNGRVYEANLRFAEMLGYSIEEVNKLAVWDWEYQLSREKLINMIQKIDEKGDHFETRHRRKDGSIYDVEISTNGAIFSGQKLVFCVCRDITERKMAERQLKDSEDYSKTLLDSFTAGAFLIEPETHTIVDVNRAAAKMFNANREDIIGHTCHQYVCPAEAGHCPATDMGQTVNVSERILLDSNSKKIPILKSVSPVTWKGRRYLFESFIDITERKKAEEALIESEHKYKTIFESANDIILLLNNKGTVVDVNSKLTEIGGWDRDDLIGKNIRSLMKIISKKSLPIVITNFLKRMAGMEVSPYRVEMKKKDGEPAVVEINATAIRKEGKVIGDLAILRDVTERVKAENRLQNQNKLIERILSTTPDAVLVISKDSSVKLCNRAFCDIFDIKQNEIVGTPISKILPSEELLQKVSKVASRNTSQIKYNFSYMSNDKHRLFIVNILPMEEGEVLLILNDATDERERQDKLYLTDRLASIGEMASGIAHELNNPLTGVVGLSQLLMEDDVPSNIKEDLEAIFSEAKRASNVVKNLLTFARKHEPIRQPTQINNIIQDVLKLRAYEHKVHDISINVHLVDELPEIMADPFQIQQVFLNIILNAEQAMLEAHGKGTLCVTTERVDGNIKASFSDNGPGITPENMRKLFSPFFTTKEVGKGTGLGLSVCYGIVTGHGGKISAQSNVGEGATFIVELPMNNSRGE
jgi:two-component system, NtrC family, sensor kinase